MAGHLRDLRVPSSCDWRELDLRHQDLKRQAPSMVVTSPDGVPVKLIYKVPRRAGHWPAFAFEVTLDKPAAGESSCPWESGAKLTGLVTDVCVCDVDALRSMLDKLVMEQAQKVAAAGVVGALEFFMVGGSKKATFSKLRESLYGREFVNASVGLRMALVHAELPCPLTPYVLRETGGISPKELVSCFYLACVHSNIMLQSRKHDLRFVGRPGKWSEFTVSLDMSKEETIPQPLSLSQFRRSVDAICIFNAGAASDMFSTLRLYQMGQLQTIFGGEPGVESFCDDPSVETLMHMYVNERMDGLANSVIAHSEAARVLVSADEDSFWCENRPDALDSLCRALFCLLLRDTPLLLELFDANEGQSLVDAIGGSDHYWLHT